MERIARLEQGVTDIRERVQGLHAKTSDAAAESRRYFERIQRELADHMIEERQLTEQLTRSTDRLAESVESLTDWRSGIEPQVRSLTIWRAYLTGAVAVLSTIAVPVAVAWVRQQLGV